MHRKQLIVAAALLFGLSLPLSASQFIDVPFDQMARESSLIVRGTIGDTWSAWDTNHEVIYTYATIRVNRYFGEATGPDILTIREVGGTVDGYTQEAVGFPAIRAGERVVLFLAPWEDGGSEMRIHAYNQGKFLVRQRGGEEILVDDPVHQGDLRPGRSLTPRADGMDPDDDGRPGLRMEEFARMVDDARSGGHPFIERDVRQ